jgi:hypothetical protein
VMSTRADRNQILCDGENCGAVASLPIALRPCLIPRHLRLPAPEGWLFILSAGPDRHFCPRCAQKQLDRITGADPEKQT